jgi:filamentous hemagglutinin
MTIASKRSQVPTLEFEDPSGNVRQVKFDGIDGDVLIDRKTSVTTFESSKDQMLRQSEALRQNGYKGRWEVPDNAEQAVARKLLDELGVTNITPTVVPR